jgi:hypothetical protein
MAYGNRKAGHLADRLFYLSETLSAPQFRSVLSHLNYRRELKAKELIAHYSHKHSRAPALRRRRMGRQIADGQNMGQKESGPNVSD